MNSSLVVTLMTLMVVLVGGLSAGQVGVNSLLAKGLANPLAAAAVNFGLGTFVLWSIFGVATYLLGAMPAVAWSVALHQLPWYYWLGGVLGSCFVLSTIIAGPVVGAAVFTAALLIGQLGVSVLLDHHGWLGFSQHSFTLGRGVGLVLLLAGLVCLKKF